MTDNTDDIELRVVIDYEQYPDLSALEQWDTPAKYYGATPKCSHGVEMRYWKLHIWTSDVKACEACDALTDGVETAKVNDGNGDDKGAVAMDKDTKEPMPFEEYMAYYGNYDRHVVLEATVEEQCKCCESWVHRASSSNIDFMDDDEWTTGSFSEEGAKKLKGYLGEVASQLIDEVRGGDDPPHCEPKAETVLSHPPVECVVALVNAVRLVLAINAAPMMQPAEHRINLDPKAKEQLHKALRPFEKHMLFTPCEEDAHGECTVTTPDFDKNDNVSRVHCTCECHKE